MQPSILLLRQQVRLPLWAVVVGTLVVIRNMISFSGSLSSTLQSSLQPQPQQGAGDSSSSIRSSSSTAAPTPTPTVNSDEENEQQLLLLSKNEQTYDAKYWAWQEKMNEFGAAIKGDILRHILQGRRTPNNNTTTTTTTVVNNILEFGCSGGYILNGMPAQHRYGVEVNPAARAHAIEKFAANITQVVERIDDIDPPSLELDVIYTTSVLEHVDCPLCELRKLKAKLKQGGILIVGLRNDGADPLQQLSRQKKDKNHHIYTWNPLLLGNMLLAAGLTPCHVIESVEAWHAINVTTYNNDKLAYCRKGLEVGQKKNVHNLWSVSVLDDNDNEDDEDAKAQSQRQCKELKVRLGQLLNCKYLQ